MTIAIPARSYNDEQLVQMAQTGCRDAFDCLVRRYQDRLYRNLLALMGSASIAEDVTQDAFIRAFVKIQQIRSQSSFYSWLFRIALNCRRIYVHPRNRMLSIDHVDADDCSMFDPRTRYDPVERNEQIQLVREALSKLHDSDRIILVLREFDNMNYRQIAATLQIELGTVRSRLFRARERLRKLLAPKIGMT